MASVGRPLHKKFSVKLLLLLLIVVLVTHHFMAGVLTQTTQRRDANWNSNNSQILKNNEDCDQKENSIVTEKIQKTTDNQAEQTVRTTETENTITFTNRAPSSRDKSPGNGTQDQTDTDRRVATARPAAAPEPPKVRHPPNILLLSSMGRSGSSFLGGLLNSQPGSFYIFEPLHSLEARRMLSDAVARETFTQIASCNFTGSLLSGLASEPDFAIRTPSAYSCKHTKKANQTCFDAKKLKQACDKLPIKIIKTIRTRVAWLEPLLRDPRANLLAIHLVRDPRASIISAIERDWNVRPERKCSELEDDLLSGLQLEKLLPGRYMTVRYEDLCEDPYKMARIIFSFLGYKTLPLSTLSFLEKSTAKSDGQTYGIRRDTSKQQQKWRQEITTEQLQGIEEACASAIAAVGFNLFADIGRARNLSVPLYDPAKASVFFPYYGGR
ncbi:carbohydrate sulfotransferase 3-like isoform X2 [Penaeus chinensis]|uniref:carbohydrate sulfotransferase 3-like isoform X2 n=1 Tax=Penaeus chinensis TaxID=139456 RepID=UPI001FB5B2A7|nr:carbohydrate sulfotransferase 3-like isoform X2 [Penaeus chinensis]XP_047484541.1 carbohydrate sulfotransferase 3-like isoform X2 [Penaeus chinensis]XP_047484551.1 carbohydrate sulfotransferase 3-like isoform X2 [Penaeus chinensis]XP_047484558.1 carbohydrate sulfotransferase 3-like isoform X2 [Penaeus chinensis]